jgi:hypothetical protein
MLLVASKSSKSVGVVEALDVMDALDVATGVATRGFAELSWSGHKHASMIGPGGNQVLITSQTHTRS